MANNNNLYNAVIAGACGGNQQRWITDTVSSQYATFQAIIAEIATSIDAAIEPIVGGGNSAQSALMQSIVQGIFAGRLLQNVQEANYAPIVESIVALYVQLSESLQPSSGGGGSPLSLTLWVDELAADGGNGSIDSPFNDLQDAMDALDPLVIAAGHSGTIMLAAGTYAEGDWTTAQGLSIVGVGESSVITSLIVGELTSVELLNLSVDSIAVGANATLLMSNCVQGPDNPIAPGDASSRVEIVNSTIAGVNGNGIAILTGCTVTIGNNVGAAGELTMIDCNSDSAEPADSLAGSMFLWNCEWGGGLNAAAEIQIDRATYDRIILGGHTITSPSINFLTTPNNGTIEGQPLYWTGTQWAPLPANTTLIVDSMFAGVSGLLNVGAQNTLTLLGNIAGENFNSYTLGTVHIFKMEEITVLEMGKDVSDNPLFGAMGATPVGRQSITGATTQTQVDSLVTALVNLGFVTDDR